MAATECGINAMLAMRRFTMRAPRAVAECVQDGKSDGAQASILHLQMLPSPSSSLVRRGAKRNRVVPLSRNK